MLCLGCACGVGKHFQPNRRRIDEAIFFTILLLFLSHKDTSI